MKARPLPPLSIAVINYNGRDVLPDTLDALERARRSGWEILVVDDGSDDGSPEWVEEVHPDVRVIRMEENTARLNRLRNIALDAAIHRHVFLTDNDIVVEEGCLEALFDVMRSRQDVLCCTPRVVYRGDPERIYHDGGALHYLCVSAASGGSDRTGAASSGEPRPTIGGGIMLVDRETAARIGGFDGGYLFGWGDDGEFHVRGRLAGHRVLQLSAAVVRHGERSAGTERARGQIYNRYRLLLTAYSARSLALLAPALLAFEIALTVASVAGGFFRDRMDGLRKALGDLGEIRERRREVQSQRRVRDGELLVGGGITEPDAVAGSPTVRVGARLLESAAEAYWRAVRPLL